MPFYFWTVILGMVVGAGIAWFLLADHPFESREAPGGPVDDLEAGVITTQLEAEGIELPEATIVRVLELHGAYVVGEGTMAATPAEVEPADRAEPEPAPNA